MKSYTFIVGVGLFFTFNIQAAQSDCSVNNYNDLVRCSELNSKNLQITNQKLKTAEQLESAANQWVNPEIDLESVSKNSDMSEQTATVYFNLSLGGKRSAQVSQARAEYDKASVLNELDKQSERLSLMLSYYRLGHLKSEIKIEEESVATFSKVIKQYQGRSALSPEQDVSLTVFKMALADHQLNLVKIKSDYENLLGEVMITTGLDKETILKNLPKAKSDWLKIVQDADTLQSPQVKLAQHEVSLAKTKKSMANAESWPELKVGPTFQRNKQGSETENLAGFSLSMPLPVFSLNGGGRELARQKIIESEMSFDLEKNKVSALRKQLVNKYINTTEILKSTLSSKVVSDNHEKLERQFFRGTVPSSLIIEAHRQLYDLESKRNESERIAIESLGQILIIDNKFSEVIL
jgi:outer membrane protein, heavy metal efflux system